MKKTLILLVVLAALVGAFYAFNAYIHHEKQGDGPGNPQQPIKGELDGGGEADPARMKLDMKTWIWISALYNDERELRPKKEGQFTLTFEPKTGTFSAGTDCNASGGKYVVEGEGRITFSEIESTEMFCQGSQEAEFWSLLQTASGYHFTSRGQLILDLKFDSGSAIFR